MVAQFSRVDEGHEDKWMDMEVGVSFWNRCPFS